MSNIRTSEQQIQDKIAEGCKKYTEYSLLLTVGIIFEDLKNLAQNNPEMQTVLSTYNEERIYQIVWSHRNPQ